MQPRDVVSRALDWWSYWRGLVGAVVYAAVVVAITVFLVGWFQETATQLRCEGGPDRVVVCTVTSRYRLRTAETVVAGVTGVGVRERSSEGEEYYRLELLTGSGPSGPALTWEFDEWRRAKREADRLAEVIAVAPGHSVTEQTRPPQLQRETSRWLVIMVFVTGMSWFAFLIGAEWLEAFVRSRSPRRVN